MTEDEAWEHLRRYMQRVGEMMDRWSLDHPSPPLFYRKDPS